MNGLTVEKYLWQGLTRLLAVFDGNNSLLMRFEYADDRMPVAMRIGSATYYLNYDQVGSLRAVADSSGSVVKWITYDSFGNVLTDTNPGFTVPFGFAGGLIDRDTALVRFGYRDYDSEVGRWTAKDPIGFAGGNTDLYGYVLNSPVNFVDSLGLYCKIVWSDPFAGGNPLRQWETQETIGYWEAVTKWLLVEAILARSRLPIPNVGKYEYTVRHTIWQSHKEYIAFWEVCYDECTGEETSRNYIGRGETGKTQELIIKQWDELKKID